MDIYIVTSRERGIIGARKISKDAETLKKEQIYHEEMMGSRPGVSVTKTKLK